MWEEDNEFEVLQDIEQEDLEDAMYDDSLFGQTEPLPYEDDSEYDPDDDLYFDEDDERY
jgi:hypothetical protein